MISHIGPIEHIEVVESLVLWAIPGASSSGVHEALDDLQTKLLAEKCLTYKAYWQDALSASDTQAISSPKDYRGPLLLVAFLSMPRLQMLCTPSVCLSGSYEQVFGKIYALISS